MITPRCWDQHHPSDFCRRHSMRIQECLTSAGRAVTHANADEPHATFLSPNLPASGQCGAADMPCALGMHSALAKQQRITLCWRRMWSCWMIWMTSRTSYAPGTAAPARRPASAKVRGIAPGRCHCVYEVCKALAGTVILASSGGHSSVTGFVQGQERLCSSVLLIRRWACGACANPDGALWYTRSQQAAGGGAAAGGAAGGAPQAAAARPGRADH